jgi:hypothetical protein
VTDLILEQMAYELKCALEARGLDPSDPPSQSQPPADAAFAEYQKRGGTQCTDAQSLALALVAEVVSQSKQD